MSGMHHTLKQLSVGVAVAASLAVVAAPSAPAARTSNACTQLSQQSPYPGWVSVTDEQGVPTLYLIGYAPDLTPSCSSADSVTTFPTQAPLGADTIVKSPYAGWTVVTDEQGVPWLFPVAQTASFDRGSASETTIKSPDPGWAVVIDEQGVPWLYPIGRLFN
jgi:hypothetical protein